MLDSCARARLQLLEVVHLGPAVGVDAQPIAYRAAEQLIHRHPGALAGEIPHRLLDTRDRRVKVHRAAAIAEVVVNRVGPRLNPRRVPAHDVAPHRLEVRRDLDVAVRLRVALAPAVQPVGRFQSDEAEVLAGDISVGLAGVGRGRMDQVVAQVDDGGICH